MPEHNGHTAPLLDVRGLTVNYGPITAVRNVSLHVGEGEIVALLGPNGAGKTSVLRGVTALVRPAAGRVRMAGGRVDDPSKAVALGIAHVPEGRRVFPGLSVRDNLLVGGWAVSSRQARLREREALVLDLFPRLAERHEQRAGQLSGGEQQMLAIGRALMSEPRLLLIDELSLGLAPMVVDTLVERLVELNRTGVSLLLIEQFVHRALGIADRVYMLSKGRVAFEGTPADAARTGAIEEAYLLGAGT
ncbi:MAG: ABC transporter ATP-binding protein [Actinobacteria bacterium]|nr:ABC transporter ATP-binding protein [Actinomycetota bacterium]MBV9936708.1 ABC transporter ATP-binding protein [Actinomycetota bacterium]